MDTENPQKCRAAGLCRLFFLKIYSHHEHCIWKERAVQGYFPTPLFCYLADFLEESIVNCETNHILFLRIELCGWVPDFHFLVFAPSSQPVKYLHTYSIPFSACCFDHMSFQVVPKAQLFLVPLAYLYPPCRLI